MGSYAYVCARGVRGRACAAVANSTSSHVPVQARMSTEASGCVVVVVAVAVAGVAACDAKET